MSSTEDQAQAPQLARQLNLFDATMMVAGGIIGSGIFINPPIVAQAYPHPVGVLGLWIAGGLLALIGALCYAELGGLMPRAGGQFVYLSRGIHPLMGFLYGWALLLIIGTGAIAAVAVTFATYLGYFVPLSAWGIKLVAIAAIVLLSAINYIGIKPGSATQNIFTILKIAAIAALVLLGFLARPISATSGGSASLPASLSLLWWSAIASGMVPILFAYGGWQQTNFIAEEIRTPERNLPWALLVGVLVVIVLYVSVNFAYMRVLPFETFLSSRAVAADAVRQLVGERGSLFIAAAIMASTFGFTNLAILVSPRVYFAMARDGLFFQSMSYVHPRFRTPSRGILFQGVWACLLTLSGTYERLLGYVVFADWIFFSLTALCVIIFRRTMRDAERPFRMLGSPWLPALFAAAGLGVVFNTLFTIPFESWMGALILLAGIPAFLFWRRTGHIPQSNDKTQCGL